MRFTGGHDDTLSALLASLLGDKWDMKWPPYASLLSFELYSGRGHAQSNHYIRVVFNGQALNLSCRICADAKDSSKCLSLCAVDDFIKLLSFAPSANQDCINSQSVVQSYDKPFFKDTDKNIFNSTDLRSSCINNTILAPELQVTQSNSRFSIDFIKDTLIFVSGIFIGALLLCFYQNPMSSGRRLFKNNEYREISLQDSPPEDEEVTL